jgi:hypothetical protein
MPSPALEQSTFTPTRRRDRDCVSVQFFATRTTPTRERIAPEPTGNINIDEHNVGSISTINRKDPSPIQMQQRNRLSAKPA